MSDSLKQIIYVSKGARVVSEDELSQMCEEFAEKNAESEVTGILICLGNYFVQAIEGPFPNIQTLVDKISADTRHSCFTILVDHFAEQRAFKEWGMACIDLNSRYYVNVTNLAAEKSRLQRFLRSKQNSPGAVEAILVDITEKIRNAAPLLALNSK